MSSLPVREAVSHVDLNDKSTVWVLGSNLQIGAHGEVLGKEQCRLIWHETSIQENLRSMKVELDEVIPRIVTPLQTVPSNR